ncbi:trimeric intracellular cation channel family protein [Neisseria sp. CCUG12390]|uniref:trimeric intracellular cation channel family protein n=1 Tax=Neisseria sp. CCUG12390 TaxID=3392035 RepID=UPI003A0FFE87
MTATDIIHIIGTIAFALSGYLVGARKRLDMLGVWICALLTAIGGGLIRDALVGRMPLVFTEYGTLTITALTVLAAWLFKVQNHQGRVLAEAFAWADSLGLVAFTITGAQVGLMYVLNVFGVVMLGFITAVGGGVVRDVLVNEIPMIMRQDFYGTVAVIVALAVFLLDRLNALNPLTLNILLIGGYVLRMWAYKTRLTLPKL